MNPLLEKFNTPFETAPFHLIQTEHYLPAIEQAILEAKKEIELIKSHQDPDFINTIEALDEAGSKLNIISGIFFNLNAAETNSEIQKLAREISPLITSHSNDILLDPILFDNVNAVFQKKHSLGLDEEQSTLLDKTYKSFVRNGARLNSADKTRLREIDKDLSQLGLQFGENVLEETNKYELLIEAKNDLQGLPEGVVEAASLTATEKGKEGTWIFTLAFPSYIPFMTYADNRKLRKEIYLAYNSKSSKGDDLDNREIIKSIVKLKDERAKILGYAKYADFVLEERMAENQAKVKDFLEDLLMKSKPKAKQEVRELEEFARQLDGIYSLEKWDFAYYSEKLKKEKYKVDDELLKPYFQLEKVVQGIFETAGKLFDLEFVENKAIPLYHEDVTAYEVLNKEGEHVAVFYADFFPRVGKRNGAWMTSFRGQKKSKLHDQRPHVSIVCNFTKPTDKRPSLLTFNEVTTLFHEFGHALHGMLANGRYESLSGTSVYWDFVELPSQIMENWCYEKECLDIFAKHYQTGEKIPSELVEKIKKASTFHQGYQTVRQISLGLLDLSYHSVDPASINDVYLFENEAMKTTELLNPVAGTMMSPSFSHIFQGGYSAGYYSYKWAEVLDADAFELFIENGIFDKKTAASFKENILSAGGKIHPSLLYKRFRGRDPKPEALLKRAGLL